MANTTPQLPPSQPSPWRGLAARLYGAAEVLSALGLLAFAGWGLTTWLERRDARVRGAEAAHRPSAVLCPHCRGPLTPVRVRGEATLNRCLQCTPLTTLTCSYCHADLALCATEDERPALACTWCEPAHVGDGDRTECVLEHGVCHVPAHYVSSRVRQDRAAHHGDLTDPPSPAVKPGAP